MSTQTLIYIAWGLGISTFLMMLLCLLMLLVCGVAIYIAYNSITSLDQVSTELEEVYIARDNFSYVFEPIKDLHVLLTVMNGMKKFKNDPILENLSVAINSAVNDIEAFMEEYEVDHEDFNGRVEYVKSQLEDL